MLKEIREFLGWDTPMVPAFDLPSLARALGFFDRTDCTSRRFGRCPGKEYCADCHWSEGGIRAES
jgi:hypothetical protein